MTTKKTTKKTAKTARRKPKQVDPKPEVAAVADEPPVLSPREQKRLERDRRRREEENRLKAQEDAQRDREARRQQKAAERAVQVGPVVPSNVVPMPNAGQPPEITVSIDEAARWKVTALQQAVRLAQHPLKEIVKRELTEEFHRRLQALVVKDPAASKAQREYAEAVNSLSDTIEAQHPGYAVETLAPERCEATLKLDPPNVGKNRIPVLNTGEG